MARELAIAEAVGRTRHKTEWLRRVLHATGRETVPMSLAGKNLGVWSMGEGFHCPSTGDPLPYAPNALGILERVDASWYSLLETEDATREACDGILALLEKIAADPV